MVKLQNIINLTLGSISPTSASPTPTYSKELLKNLKDLAQGATSITDSEGRSYLDQLDPSVHTNTWLSIFSAYFRWLVETRSDEIYSSLYLLKLSIPKFDIGQISVLPNLIGDLSIQLSSLALNNSLTIEELPNQKLAILKLLLNLKTKLPNQSLLNPIHSNILKICLKTKAYHIGLKLIQEHAYLDIDVKESPIQIQDYLTFHYYSALIHIGYKNYQSALEHFMLVLIVPGKSVSQVQLESVKKGILIDLLTLKDQQDERFKKLIHRALNDNQKYAALYTQFKSASNIDQWKTHLLEDKDLFENDNNWGLLQQVTNAYFPTKILALKEFKLLSFSQLGEYIGIRSVDEVETILVELIQSGKLNAKISFNKQLGPSNGLVEFMNHKLPPNARERFDKLVGEIENTLELNKILQQAGITAAANLKRTSNFDSDPEVLSQFNSMLVD